MKELRTTSYCAVLLPLTAPFFRAMPRLYSSFHGKDWREALFWHFMGYLGSALPLVEHTANVFDIQFLTPTTSDIISVFTFFLARSSAQPLFLHLGKLQVNFGYLTFFVSFPTSSEYQVYTVNYCVHFPVFFPDLF